MPEVWKFAETQSLQKYFLRILPRLDISFAVVFKTFQSVYFPEHISMTASVSVETVFLKVLRLFKKVLLRNHNRK